MTNEPELYAIAAKLAKVQTDDLLEVWKQGDNLFVVLKTGQQHTFNPAQIAEAVESEAAITLPADVGAKQDPPASPAPPKPVRTDVGAKQAVPASPAQPKPERKSRKPGKR